jgi:hypothetical protein
MDANYILGEAVKGLVITAGLFLKDWIQLQRLKPHQRQSRRKNKRAKRPGGRTSACS